MPSHTVSNSSHLITQHSFLKNQVLRTQGKLKTLSFTVQGMFFNLSLIHIIQGIWNESPLLSQCISAYSGTHSPSGVISCNEQFFKMRQL